MRNLLAIVLFALQGCAHSQAEPDLRTMAEVRPPARQSTVVVYRSVTNSRSASMGVTLGIDGVAVGELSRDSYAVIDVAPGRHVLSARGAAAETELEVTAEAGAVQFVQLETAPALELSARDAQVARVEIATDCSFGFRQSAAPVQAEATGNPKT